MLTKEKLNFIWFCVDQQRFDTISGMGNNAIRTPNLDRLIKEGIGFKNAYTQSNVCTPSRASFLTGRYPLSTRVLYNGNDTFPEDEVPVTRILADNGYICGLTGKLHLTGAQGRVEKRTDDGYSFFQWSQHPHDDWPDGSNKYQEWLKSKGLKWSELYGGKYLSMTQWPPVMREGFSGKEVGPPAEYHQTTWCVNEAIRFIDQHAEQPWLVSINPFDPHPPLDPPQEYKDKLNIADMPLPLWKPGELDNKPPFHKRDYKIGGQNGCAESIIGMSDNDKREAVRDYYAEIMLIDDQIGRLIEYLESKGLRENTVIIFMSDHGEMNGDHGLYWKGAYFYEQIVHVPLIISCPGLIQQGIISEALVELVDVAPTILELVGLDIPKRMEGKSLAPLLKGEKPHFIHKEAVSCGYYSSLLNCHDDIFATMYFDGRYKIVVYHGKDFGELYDFSVDPEEYFNLWDNADKASLRNKLIKKCFDNAIMSNIDWSLGKIGTY